MKCIDAKKYISKSIDNTLEKHIEIELNKHINQCPNCKAFYSELKCLNNSMKNAFIEKTLPEGFENKIIRNLPDIKQKNNLGGVIIMKKNKIFGLVAIIIVALIIPWYGKSPISKFYQVMTAKSTKSTDIATVLMLNDITYTLSNDVLVDERIIDKEIGKIKFTINDEHTNEKLQNGYATMLPVGTIVYSIKDISKDTTVAVNFNGKWIIYRAIGQHTLLPLFSEDYINAKKIVVTYNDNGKTVSNEITDTNTIKTVAEYLKNLKPEDKMSYYYNSKYCNFYFYVENQSGIGKIVPNYSFSFADPSLGGFISYDKNYKATPEILKLLTPNSISGGYNAHLGGSYQIYDVYLSPKILIRRYIKDENGPKPEIKVINKGEKIWSNGKLIDDNLLGNFKLSLTLKSTTIQEGIIEKLKTDYKNIPMAVSISVTKGENNDTTMIYIGFDKKPDYIFQESGDTILVIMN